MTEFNISFVCLGNICRSPMAEGVFKHLVEQAGLAQQFHIESAGIGGWHAGERADERARATARAHGLNLTGGARQFKPADFNRLNLIIALDSDVASDLRRMAPTQADRSKVRLLREFDPARSAPGGRATDLDVPDPYYGGPEGFENAYQMIERSSRALLESLAPRLNVLPTPVTAYAASRGWGRVTAAQPVSGGCINDGQVLTTESGPRLFLKTNASAQSDMFLREAEALAALGAAPGGPRVPTALLHGDTFLLLEYLAPAPPTPDYWPGLGRQLAQLHRVVQTAFGFEHDNYIGATPQPNPRTADGYAFFGESRLRFQAQRAHQRGWLGADGVRRVERLITRLPRLVPAQPASLIHGDLWSGNIIPGPEGQACLIDPAAHFGWAEADLAMTTLFGRPPQSFFAAYTSERPLEPGYRDRFELYNLYHLLNHLNLFGTSYLSSVEAVLARFA